MAFFQEFHAGPGSALPETSVLEDVTKELMHNHELSEDTHSYISVPLKQWRESARSVDPVLGIIRSAES